MGTLTVRNCSEELKSELRVQAAKWGRSMEEDVRQLIKEAVEKPRSPYKNLAEAIRARFEPLGGVELDIPPRTPMREPPDFSGPESDR